MRNNCFHRTAAPRSLCRSCTRVPSQTTTREEARVLGTSRPSCTKSGDHEPRLFASRHERRHHVHNTCQASSTPVRHQLQSYRCLILPLGKALLRCQRVASATSPSAHNQSRRPKSACWTTAPHFLPARPSMDEGRLEAPKEIQ